MSSLSTCTTSKSIPACQLLSEACNFCFLVPDSVPPHGSLISLDKQALLRNAIGQALLGPRIKAVVSPIMPVMSTQDLITMRANLSH